MQLLSLASAGLILSAVLGAAGSPVNPQGNSVNVRAVEFNSRSAPVAAVEARAAESSILERNENGLDARAENTALTKRQGLEQPSRCRLRIQARRPGPAC
ncbi:uncharacterized protein DSM5745_08051 [Aspergillus mulundensis]|uniref:Uncharacterized protein n=1 Tax=Aspergillus mulundensis TaxID=1810919 RepID=A0A3D8R995_9EURO|nr:hypothetical protein DSM5745_08051 [Aspergillus mulundensis]RDW70540.1 hypothetical protein DSM5745_08051 [Aspergillus mulundensis]